MSLLQKNPHLAVRKIAEEIFIYHRQGGFIHSFNETGAFLWEKLDECGPAPDVLAQHLMESYEVDPVTARADINAFLTECENKKLLTPHE
ncbi:MAG: PqqD family protein [Chitinivibrionales bacterium]|nr:PqqD family protein [Chitinivibrionales bacterium]